jgi:hypothetical protein
LVNRGVLNRRAAEQFSANSDDEKYVTHAPYSPVNIRTSRAPSLSVD